MFIEIRFCIIKRLAKILQYVSRIYFGVYFSYFCLLLYLYDKEYFLALGNSQRKQIQTTSTQIDAANPGYLAPFNILATK